MKFTDSLLFYIFAKNTARIMEGKRYLKGIMMKSLLIVLGTSIAIMIVVFGIVGSMFALGVIESHPTTVIESRVLSESFE